jgi:hypothetical protein
MTHFTVLVAAKSPAHLDELLAPYDEGKQVAPYRDYEDGGPADYWAVKHLREENGLNPDDTTLTWQEVADCYNAKYRSDIEDNGNEGLRVDEEGRAYRISTYNPDSKWDYWRVGGRWGGEFPIACGHENEVLRPEADWDSPEAMPADHCDGGPKGALDLKRMRDDAERKARKDHREYTALVKGTPEALPWSAFAENISEAVGYTPDQAQIEYNSQPRVVRLKGSKWADPFGWDPITEFSVDEDAYAARQRARAVPGYALLTAAGEWVAPGEMGFWAMSTDGPADRIDYCEKANAYIDALPDDMWLIMVDCHI